MSKARTSNLQRYHGSLVVSRRASVGQPFEGAHHDDVSLCQYLRAGIDVAQHDKVAKVLHRLP